MKALKLDALYTIFEKHLYCLSDDSKNKQEFTDKVLRDYLHFLNEQKIIIPSQWHRLICEELTIQINRMLLQKTYGCLNIQEFILNQPTVKVKRRNAKKKYSKLFR